MDAHSKDVDASRKGEVGAEIKDRFAEIANIATKASYDHISTMDALVEIERLWDEIEQLMLTDKVTQPGNPPHFYIGGKW